MPHRKLRIALYLSITMILGAALTAPVFAGADKLKVVVSILPQAYFVERIGGDKVEVWAMMPKYADHDTFEPTPKQLIMLSQADVYVKIGISHFNFEQKYLDPIVSMRRNIVIGNMSRGIPLRPDDPHIWLSPYTVRIAVLNIYNTLAARLPSEAKTFKNNLDRLLQEVDDLDGKIQKLLDRKKGASFLIFHPALGYFADRYGLKQLVIESEGKSPSAMHLRKLTDEARAKKLHSILVQKGFDHKSATAIAEEIGAVLQEIDPMEKDWLKNTWQIAQKVNEALGQ